MANLKIYKFDHVDISLVSVHNLMGETADKDTVDTYLFFPVSGFPHKKNCWKLLTSQCLFHQFCHLPFITPRGASENCSMLFWRHFLWLGLFWSHFASSLQSLDLDEDPYKILGVPRSASSAEIKKAYKKMARNW